MESTRFSVSHPDKMANETGENGLEKKVSDLTGVAFSEISLFDQKLRKNFVNAVKPDSIPLTSRIIYFS